MRLLAAVDHKVDIGAQNVYHLYGAVDNYITLHTNKQSVLRKHCVKSSECIVAGVGKARIMLSHKLRMGIGIIGKRCNLNTLWQIFLRLQRLAELVVDDEI